MTQASHRIREARHHVMAIAVIVAAHLALGFWLARVPQTSTVARPLFIAIDLAPGSGGVAGPVTAGSPPARAPTVAEGEAQLDAGEERAEASPDSGPPAPVPPGAEPPTTETPTPPAPDVVSTVRLTPAETPTSADVLAMVEALTGTEATDLVDPATLAVEASLSTSGASQPGSGGGCDLGETIRTRLLSDAAALRELTNYPVTDRSVANAIQLWNGDWLAGAQDTGAPALPEVRDVIFAAVAEAPDACRAAPLQGPRFVFLTAPGTTPLVLVMGSGDWRWGDLRAPDTPRLLRGFGLGRRGR